MVADDAIFIDGSLFRASLQRRMRIPIFDGSETCPFCGAPMNRFGDQATVCACGGGRLARHNAARDQVYSELLELGC